MSESMAGSSKLALFFSSFFSDVLVAPLAEEFFFRGLVLRGYLGRYSMTKAAWASAVFFAVFHLNPWQAVVVLLPGLGFTWLFLRTGSLVPGILSHATVNFSVSFLLALGYDLEASHCPPSLLAIAGAMAGIGGFFLWRQLAKPPNERSA
jgi:membrane protease YdiL (CAAX protease family)